MPQLDDAVRRGLLDRRLNCVGSRRRHRAALRGGACHRARRWDARPARARRIAGQLPPIDHAHVAADQLLHTGVFLGAVGQPAATPSQAALTGPVLRCPT
jgi:hypothetical protein